MKKRLLALCLCALMVLVPGCSRESGESIRVDLEGTVETLDPQFSTSWESQVILLNTMEGLLVRDGQGTLQPGAAESWEVSADGLTYTFHLREDAVWDDANSKEGKAATPVTAHDFVFAFHRIFDPQTPSPWAEDFSAIRGARQVLAGELPKEQLGVRAADDHTLVITLSEPSPVLPELLAGSGALPCNQEFFESTRARYGQGTSYLLSNGPFYISAWDEEALVLRPNSAYTGEQEALCPSVVLYTGRAALENTTAWQLFLDGKSDFCLAGSLTAQELEGQDFSFYPAEDTVWALVFRQEEGSVLADTDVRRALLLSVDRDGFGERLPQRFSLTGSLVPGSATLLGQEYRELAAVSQGSLYNPEKAREALSAGLERLELESLPKLTLLLPESAQLGSLGGYLQRVWQDELLQYINLEILEDGEFEKRLAAGNFQMAIAPLDAGSGSPMDALAAFSTGSSTNICLYQDPEFDLLLAQARTAPDAQEAADLCLRCEKRLEEQAAAMPLFSQQGYYAVARGVEGLRYHQGSILFSGASRK
jgi:oligopeptide transport system substrate-binding protein